MDADLIITPLADDQGRFVQTSIMLRIGVLRISFDLPPHQSRAIARELLEDPSWPHAGVAGNTTRFVKDVRIDCPFLPWVRFDKNGRNSDYARVSAESFLESTDWEKTVQ